MENNLQNSLFQLKNILNELNVHINQINELIFKMNNIINQVNNPMLNEIDNQINQMNNYMGGIINNQMNFNMNNFQAKNQINNIFSNDLINVGFKFNHTEGPIDDLIVINKNLTINELIDSYLKKINKLEYINNYDKCLSFLFDAKDIKQYKKSLIKEIIPFDKCYIVVNPNNFFK